MATRTVKVHVRAGDISQIPDPPKGTLKVILKVVEGDGTTQIRVREREGLEGAGSIITTVVTRAFGGLGGSIAPLEVENVHGPDAVVSVEYQF